MGGVTVANKNSNVQVVMDTGYVYTWENWLKSSILSVVVLLFLLQ